MEDNRFEQVHNYSLSLSLLSYLFLMNIQKRESESKYCLSDMNAAFLLPKWTASLFALSSFAYFCCQKYKYDSVRSA